MSKSDVDKYFTNTISRDLLELFVGDMIGQGSTRIVCKGHNNTVLKFETNAKRFQNIVEWETWQIVKHTKHARWFVPCIDISDNGGILIQHYARDIEENLLPLEVPAFFCDLKKDNWGVYNGLPVCRDYGNHYLIDNGLSKKMQKVIW